MRPIIALAALLALAACQPQAPDGAPAPPPADAPPAPAQPTAPVATPPALPADFTGDLKAVGTEPFWGVVIAGGAVTLSRPDHPDVTAPAGPPQMVGDRAVWTQEAGGQPLVVSLSKAPCSDGMSDRSYPLIAEVKVGETTLTGCAAKAEPTPAAK